MSHAFHATKFNNNETCFILMRHYEEYLNHYEISFAKQILDKRFGFDFLEKRLERIFSPSLLLVRAGSEREAELLLYEEETAREENASLSMMMGLLSRFIREESLPDPTGEDGEAEESSGVLGGMLERIKRIIKRG